MVTVLVVEDSFSQRQLLTNILEASNFQVATASDGKEALEYLAQFCPDLILLDIIMPNLNGYDVCRHLKKNPQTQNLPVIICSSKGEELDLYWGFKQGADAYLVKPFQPKTLVETVKQLTTA
ncbi:MAG: response regulator [Oscillatoria sp. PMC 1068.18]|nr:response regulator [Oscillatoria sp. PMC 1076.18]MEC4991000.1 response regulator [Oscillatoria sp. PMC 1068.18]